jgi:PhnB protein
MHACLEVGGFSLMGCDAPAGDEHAPGRNLCVALSVPADEAERIFGGLADGGRITMPFENTFWSPGLGMLVDRFGIPWIINVDPGS